MRPCAARIAKGSGANWVPTLVFVRLMFSAHYPASVLDLSSKILNPAGRTMMMDMTDADTTDASPLRITFDELESYVGKTLGHSSWATG